MENKKDVPDEEEEDTQFEDTKIRKLSEQGSSVTNQDSYLEEIKRLTKYVSNHPVIISCLYDCGLMPEQCEENSYDQYRMGIIISHFEICINAINRKVE